MTKHDEIDEATHRSLAIAANNATWGLLGEVAEPGVVGTAPAGLLDTAHAAAYHWARAADRGPVNEARATWLLSRCYVVLGHGDLALEYADRCTAVVTAAGLVDFDLGYAHEARARALACLGRLDEAATELAAARATPVAEDEDREVYTSDLESPPWFGLDTAGSVGG